MKLIDGEKFIHSTYIFKELDLYMILGMERNG